MLEGSGLHLQYFKFFDIIDYDCLAKLDWQTEIGNDGNDVYKYFLSTILTNLGTTSEQISNEHFLNNIKNFCLLEADHWYSLRMTYNNISKCIGMFCPSVREREVFLVNDSNQLYGTIDRIINEEHKVIISDYKTGMIPIGVQEERKNGIYSAANGLPTKQKLEGTYYCVLYLLSKGYRFKYLVENDDWECYNEKGELDKSFTKWLDYAFIYTNGKNRYYIARKKISIITVKNVLNIIAKIRKEEKWEPNPNPYNCQNCSYYQDYCRGKIDVEILGDIRGSEDDSVSDVYGSERCYQ